MTLAGAQKILSGKLEFGNKEQIDARKFLEDVEIYVDYGRTSSGHRKD